MKLEEELVKEIIIGHIKNSEDKEAFIEYGEDPPDFYMNLNGQKIMLEVTNAEDVFLNTEGEIEIERRGLDATLSRYISSLREKYDGNIPNDDSILIFFQGPFVEFNKFKTHIDNLIDDICKNNRQIDDEFEINSGKIKIKKINYVKNKIVGYIGVKHNKFSGKIETHTEIILTNIIRKKEIKTSEVDGETWEGEKWLGILNNSVLADLETYYRALRRIHVQHGFSRIYIVDPEGNIKDLLK